MLLPRIEKIKEEHNGTIHLVKVDIDDIVEIAIEYRQYGVSIFCSTRTSFNKRRQGSKKNNWSTSNWE